MAEVVSWIWLGGLIRPAGQVRIYVLRSDDSSATIHSGDEHTHTHGGNFFRSSQSFFFVRSQCNILVHGG